MKTLTTYTADLVINEPNPSRPDLPIFPLSAEREKFIRPLGKFHCPICAMKESAQKYVRLRQFEGVSPKSILTGLRRMHITPMDRDRQVINNHLDFEQAMGIHLLHCLAEDNQTYTALWKRRLEDERDSAALAKQKQLMGMAQPGTLNQSQQYGSHNGLYAEAQSVGIDLESMNMADALKMAFTQQIQIIVVEQRKMITGEREDAPVKEFNTLSGLVTTMEKLLGKFAVQSLINEVPGADSLMGGSKPSPGPNSESGAEGSSEDIKAA